MGWKISNQTLNLAAGAHSQDRVSVKVGGPKILLVLADGAGGMSGGAEAAEMLVSYFIGLKTADQRDICIHFYTIDSMLAGSRKTGETTAVAIVIENNRLFGASVGDSEAWFVSEGDQPIELTVRQRRKPLLGSGEALAIPFEMSLQPGTLIVGSDGLFKYAKRDRIIARARDARFDGLCEELADLARLPGGGLQDDLSVALVRFQP